MMFINTSQLCSCQQITRSLYKYLSAVNYDTTCFKESSERVALSVLVHPSQATESKTMLLQKQHLVLN